MALRGTGLRVRRSLSVAAATVAVVVGLLTSPTAWGADVSLADWWDAAYGGTYGTFDNVWTYQDWDIFYVGETGTVFKLQVEMSGFAETNAFGWFDVTMEDPLDYPGAGYQEIFSGPDAAGATKTVMLPQTKVFAFYLHTPESNTWQSVEFFESPSDPYDHHMWVFSTTNEDWLASQPGEFDTSYLMAWEDQASDIVVHPAAKHWVMENDTWVYDADQAGVPMWHTNGVTSNTDMVLTYWSQGPLTGEPLPAPTSSITAPVHGSPYSTLTQVAGSASDNDGPDVRDVEVSIRRLPDGYYWNGVTWQLGAENWQPATGTSSWTYPTSDSMWADGRQYLVRSRATNEDDGVGDPSPQALFLFSGAPITHTKLDGQEILDANPTGIESTINVSQTGAIAEVNACVNISHPYVGDIIVRVTSPGGTTVVLHNRTGGAADDIATNYDTLAAPTEALTAFNGEHCQGTWRLSVCDNALSDIGTLNWWGLQIYPSPNQPPAAPTLSSPADGSVVAPTPTLTWNVPADADGDMLDFKVEVDTADTFDSGALQVFESKSDYTGFSFSAPVPEGTGTASYTVQAPLDAGSTWHWRVSAWDGTVYGSASASQSLVVNSPPGAFSLVDPTDGHTATDRKPTFDWEDSTDNDPGDTMHYMLWYSKDESFATKTEVTGLSESTYTPTTELDDNSVYHWKVKAYDDHAGETWSNETWSLTINVDPDPPNAFDLISPANGPPVTTLRPEFSWDPATDPDPGDTVTYTLWYSTDSEFDTYTDEAGITGTSFTPTADLTENETYYWKVKAVDGAAAETWSNQTDWSFSVNATPQAPSAFSLLAPARGSIKTTRQPQFTWNAATDPDPGDSITYTLWYSTDSEFGAYTEEAGITGTSLTPTVDLDENAQYFWKVKAVDSSSLETWSTETDWDFQVNSENEPPDPFSLRAPGDGKTTDDVTPTFDWEDATDNDPGDTVQYTLWYSTHDSFAPKTEVSGLTQSTYTPTSELNDNSVYYWKVKAYDVEGGETWTGTWLFTVDRSQQRPDVAPTCMAPANSSRQTTLTPTLTVRNADDPDPDDILVYMFEVDTSDQFGSANLVRSPEVAEGTDQTSWTTPALADDTIWYWRCRAKDQSEQFSDWSATWSFVVNAQDGPPTAPTPTSPDDGARKKVFSPTLTVENSDDADPGDKQGLTYAFAVYPDSQGGDPVASAVGVAQGDGTTTSWTVDVTLEEDTEYWWSAQAVDPTPLSSGWFSPKRSFTVNTNDPPPAPDLVSPANGKTPETVRPTFEWSPVKDPEGDQVTYTVEYGTDPAFATRLQFAGRTATQFEPSSDLQNLSKYYWRVAATDEHGEQGPWSGTWSFTITKTGAISGKVIELQTGEPIAGATVEADDKSVLTDQDGAFELAVIPGEHLVPVEAAGFCPCQRAVTVRSGEAISECDFTLVRQPAVSGLAMVSFPLTFSRAAVGDIWDETPLQMAAWDAAAQQYIYKGAAGFPDAAIGRGFWVHVEGETSPAIAQAGDAPDQTQPVSLPLEADWNLVGMPFASEVHFSKITTVPSSQIYPFAWVYRGSRGYRLVSPADLLNAEKTLKPWEACWIKAKASTTLTIAPPTTGVGAAQVGQADSPVKLPEGQWIARVTARADGRADTDNFFGILAASRAPEVLSGIPNPPNMGQYVDVYFPSVGGRSGSFASDIRSEASNSSAWQFNVRTNTADTTVEVCFPNLSQLPRDLRPALTDLDSGKSVYLRTVSAYTYNSGPTPQDRHFRVEVGPAGLSALTIANVTVCAVRGDPVVVSYALSRSAMVEITIRNIAGRPIRTLAANRSRPAGTDSVAWDGRNAGGAAVPNGTYLCEIAASTDEGQRVRATRPVVLCR